MDGNASKMDVAVKYLRILKPGTHTFNPAAFLIIMMCDPVGTVSR